MLKGVFFHVEHSVNQYVTPCASEGIITPQPHFLLKRRKVLEYLWGSSTISGRTRIDDEGSRPKKSLYISPQISMSLCVTPEPCAFAQDSSLYSSLVSQFLITDMSICAILNHWVLHRNRPFGPSRPCQPFCPSSPMHLVLIDLMFFGERKIYGRNGPVKRTHCAHQL